MIEKIIVPTDGSDHARKAIEYASDIALKYKATIYVIHVISPIPSMGYPDLRQEVEQSQEQFAKQMLEEAVQQVKKKGVGSVQSTILHGNPAWGIIEFARETHADMIVMGSRGADSVETLLLGSVSHKVCHLAECTCVAVK